MAEVADVLGYDLAGSLRPVYLSPQMWQPPLTSVTMSVNVRILVTGPTWAIPTLAKPQNLTAGALLGIQSTGYGSVFDPVAHLMGGKVASDVSSLGFTNVGIGTGMFDSAATVPLELTGDKP
jgi:hypothetical protein